MDIRLEGYAIHLRMVVARATIPPPLKAGCAKVAAKAQVAEHGDPAPMDVHFLTACRVDRGLVPLQLSMQQVDLPARLGHLYDGLGVTQST